MVPIIGMDCHPVRDLLDRHGIPFSFVAERAGLPVTTIHAVLDDRLAATRTAAETLAVRTAIELILPGESQALRRCWRDCDQRIVSSARRSGPPSA